MPQTRTIEQRVAELLRELGIREAPVDVDRIAEERGVVVRYQRTEDDVSGMLYRDEQGRAVIGINEFHHPNRQRFTLAHELGHLLLHDSKMYLDTPRAAVRMRNARSSSGTDVEEVAANRFAAALLMPAAFLRRDLEQSGLLSALPHVDELDFFQLARRYGVSTQALTLRLVNLGLLKPDPEI